MLNSASQILKQNNNWMKKVTTREDNIELAFRWNHLQCKPSQIRFLLRNEQVDSPLKYVSVDLPWAGRRVGLWESLFLKRKWSPSSLRGRFNPPYLETHFETLAKGRFYLRVQKKKLRKLFKPWYLPDCYILKIAFRYSCVNNCNNSIL